MPAEEAGLAAIEGGLREFYKSQRGAVNQQALARAISALQDVYQHNVFPTMKLTWGVQARTTTGT